MTTSSVQAQTSLVVLSAAFAVQWPLLVTTLQVSSNPRAAGNASFSSCDSSCKHLVAIQEEAAVPYVIVSNL
jgi:hypothetical protein